VTALLLTVPETLREFFLALHFENFVKFLEVKPFKV
jgi:hypothetical protein